jgi:regulator of sirC expression with transglutaminase-like and TPR domain
MNSALITNVETAWRTLREAPESLSVLRAALLVAQDEYPHLDVQECLDTISRWGEQLRDTPGREGDPIAALTRLNRFVFVEQGFCGDEADYYNPSNSYLNEVIARRKGNPVSLAVLQLQLAQSLDLPLQGISFPGNFLLRLPVDGGVLVLDPFQKGRSLDVDELKQRAKPHHPQQAVDEQDLGAWLEPVDARNIVIRMLRNLERLYLEREDDARALRCVDRLVYLDEQDSLYRDRGLLYFRIGHYRAAARDLDTYLQRAAQAEDLERVRTIAIDAHRAASRLN